MSKTTVALFFILFLAIGLFFYTKFENPKSPMMQQLTGSSQAKPLASETTLSLGASAQTVRPGQTLQVSIMISSQGLLPSLSQLELAYDPTILTVQNIFPGTFLRQPQIALQNIRPDLGRISYALKCPPQTGGNIPDCANQGSNQFATINFIVNPTVTKPQTTIAFLPKTVIRSKSGSDLLKKTTPITITVIGAMPQTASSSGISN